MWDVSKYNMGFVLNRKAYNAIKNCSKAFCNFDDYNWDWTLVELVRNCAKHKLNMWKMKMTRVFHYGNW